MAFYVTASFFIKHGNISTICVFREAVLFCTLLHLSPAKRFSLLLIPSLNTTEQNSTVNTSDADEISAKRHKSSNPDNFKVIVTSKHVTEEGKDRRTVVKIGMESETQQPTHRKCIIVGFS